jgi:hypothetical protein
LPQVSQEPNVFDQNISPVSLPNTTNLRICPCGKPQPAFIIA